MRHHIQLLHTNDNTPETLLNGTLLWEKKDFLYPERPSLPSSSSYEFSECSFTNCYSGTTGGAISLSNSQSSLSIDHNIFNGCNVPTSSDRCYGGAIYCSPSYSIIISSSSFISCNSFRGGGVYLESISHYCSVSHSLFTHCAASDWGNGLLLYKLPPTNGGSSNSNITPLPVSSSCRFLHNEHEVTTSGALYYRPLNGEHTIRENLYTSNHASLYGGAIEYNIPGNYNPTSATFYFNLFSNNYANNWGNDVLIYGNDKYNDINPFVHCFSTSNSLNRLGSCDGTFTHKDNWIPQSTLLFCIDCYSLLSSDHVVSRRKNEAFVGL